MNGGYLMSTYLPALFGENMMDMFDLFDRNWSRGFHDMDRALYGRHADRLMKTDNQENDDYQEDKIERDYLFWFLPAGVVREMEV